MTPGCSRASVAPARRAGATALLAAVLALLGVVLAAPAAHAHGAGDGIRYRLVEVSPPVDGLTVQVVRGLAGQLVLANDTGEVVEVLDPDGQPFLRIGPDGVEGDVTSPTWRASDRPFGLGGDPGEPGPGTSTWVALSGGNSWGWYDHRLHEEQLAAPTDLTEPVVLAAWEVPLRVGGRGVVARGETLAGPALGFVSPRLVSDPVVAPGVRVTLLPGQAPGLLLSADVGHEVLVRGEAGEPFLRFAGGVVEVNQASPTWHRIGGGGASAVAIDAAAAPSWLQVAGSQQFGWLEPRAAAREPDDAPASDELLATWAVPLEVDGEATTVVGELRWVRNPLLGGSETGPSPVQVLLAAVGVATIGGLLVARRHQRRGQVARPEPA